MRLSACMIMKNEAKHIAAWIDNVKDIVDECIIVDTGSVDDSVAIAKQKGIKVYHYSWNDDFAAAKNFALEKATSDWIIFLDADERLTCDTKNILREILVKVDKQKDTELVLAKRINYDIAQEKSFKSTDMVLRIFRNKDYLKFAGRIHENITNLRAGKLELLDLSKSLTIEHYGYSADCIKAKLERNLALLLREITEYGDSGEYDSYFCDCYYGLEKYEKVVYYASRFINSDYITIGNEEHIRIMLIDSMRKLNFHEVEIEATVKKAIVDVPEAFLIQSYYGRVLTRKKQYKEALPYLLSATEHLEYETKEIIHALLSLAECFVYHHQYDMAVLRYRRALKLGCDKDTVFSAIYHGFRFAEKKLLDVFYQKVFRDQQDTTYLQNKLIEFYLRPDDFNQVKIESVPKALQARFALLCADYKMAGKYAVEFIQQKQKEKIFIATKRNEMK